MNVTPIGPQGINAHTVLNDIMSQVPAESEIYCVSLVKDQSGALGIRTFWHGFPLGLVIASAELSRTGANLFNSGAANIVPPTPTRPQGPA